ncbi:hypothetical protein Cni_G18771 [Canna indica]|uniref:Uncharacterized protein n=1 Tax=Canna indica TaxID=4628 RepID=A0AAQ3KJV0_9LILI|nr:hypothetical protein Cni_G18771 [Canna indica]
MSSKISSSNLALLHNLPAAKKPSSEPAKPLRSKRRTPSITASYVKQQAAGKAAASSEELTVKFETLEGCKLGISRYPDFGYNAKGGIGTAAVGRADDKSETATADDVLPVSFDIGTLYIPPLTGATTKFLGLPLPPFLKIAIVPEIFRGIIGRGTGKVELQFRAKFLFSAGSIYRAPPLMVETTLTSEESKGAMREGRGERMDGGGRCKLVGVAVVDPIDDILMNSFLRLPTECIAILNAKISISSP